MVKRLFVIIVFGIVVIRIGIEVAPKLAYTFYGRPKTEIDEVDRFSEVDSARSQAGEPAMIFSSKSIPSILDSVKEANDSIGQVKYFVLKNLGIAIITKPDSDMSMVFACPQKDNPSEKVILSVPSTKRFRELINPAEQKDWQEKVQLPVYPNATCKMFLDYGKTGRVVLLHSPDSLEPITAYYYEILKKNGWQKTDIDAKTKMEVYRKKSAVLMLDIAKNEKNKGTNIGFIISGLN